MNIPANHIVGGLLHSSGVFKIYNRTFCENSCIIDMFDRVINTTLYSTNELIFLLQNSCYAHFIRIDEFCLWYGWPTKGIQPYFQPGPLSEILTIVNLRHAASRVWTCAETEFRFSRMKLCSSDIHYTTAPLSEIYCFIDWNIFSHHMTNIFLASMFCVYFNCKKACRINWKRWEHRKILFSLNSVPCDNWYLWNYF